MSERKARLDAVLGLALVARSSAAELHDVRRAELEPRQAELPGRSTREWCLENVGHAARELHRTDGIEVARALAQGLQDSLESFK